MEIHLVGNMPVMKTKIGDAQVEIRFSKQESHGVREALINALTISYEQRIQLQLGRLCDSLEPAQIEI